MKELVCINPKNYKLTEGKNYIVITDEGDTVMIINDNNKTVRYYKDLFNEIPEEEVVEVPARTEQDLINSIGVEGETIYYYNYDNEKITIDSSLDILNNTSSFSCGIKNLVNIGSQTREILDLIEYDQEQLEDDLISLLRALVKTYIKNFISYKSEDDFNGGIYLMSCNITGEDCLDEEIVEILNEISDFKSEPEENPNSGNEIVLWGFYKSNL